MDITDKASIVAVLKASRPDEIYNFAAQPTVPVRRERPAFGICITHPLSYVCAFCPKVSVRMPEYTAAVTGVGVLKLLNAVKELGMQKHVR